jgi:segregation and condensation protein A
MDGFAAPEASGNTGNVDAGCVGSPEKIPLTSEQIGEKLETSFWRDILYEIINTMDPWDIDISELATRYSGKVSRMNEMNFRIPANVVIVSAVLLRMKSQFMSIAGGTMDFDPAEYMDPTETDGQSVGDGMVFGGNGGLGLSENVILQPKRVLKRRITAMELIAAIQQVLEDKVVRTRIKDEELRLIDRGLVFNLHKDIKHIIDETYNRIMSILSSKEEVMFSELAQNRDEVVNTLISLLHLSNSQKLKLRQEKLFEDIHITSATIKEE